MLSWDQAQLSLIRKTNAADELHYISSDNDIYANTEVKNLNL